MGGDPVDGRHSCSQEPLPEVAVESVEQLGSPTLLPERPASVDDVGAVAHEMESGAPCSVAQTAAYSSDLATVCVPG
eukprot:15389299-Heterocapsa_arctica.AAC.1